MMASGITHWRSIAKKVLRKRLRVTSVTVLVLHLAHSWGSKITMLPFSVHFEDGVPVSDQIVQAVRRAVATGELRAGDRFPSVRTLSQDLKISPTTAHKAVGHLKSAGYLASRPGIGMVVVSPSLPGLDARLDLLKPACEQLLSEAQSLQLEFEEIIEALRRASNGDHPST